MRKATDNPEMRRAIIGCMQFEVPLAREVARVEPVQRETGSWEGIGARPG